MPVLVVDGAEKSGKSTLIRVITDGWEGQSRVRRWGPVTSDTEYLTALREDVEFPGLVVWDRSWASEHVYSVLMNRPGRLRTDPWLGEWLYGRAVDLKVVLDSHGDQRAARRDETDLPVNPYVEGAAFSEYASKYGWWVLHNDYWEDTLRANAQRIVERLASADRPRGNPPTYCGPQHSPVVVVGEARNERATFPGAWLPLTSQLTIPLGRALGSTALQIGWTNASDCRPAALRDAKLLVALGERADTWCRFHVGHRNVLRLPHPSWLFRYGSARGQVKPTVIRLITEVGKYMEVGNDGGAVEAEPAI